MCGFINLLLTFVLTQFLVPNIIDCQLKAVQFYNVNTVLQATVYKLIGIHFEILPGIIIAYLYLMKKILLPILLLLSIIAFACPQKKKCKKTKQKEIITKVEYETFARRGRTEVTITADSAISIGRTEKKFILMTAAKWNAILNSVKAVKLSSIPTWESPTKRREYDGAWHCKISISTKAKKYESQYFDSGDPMKQLQALYDAIDSLRHAIESDGKQYMQ